MKDEEKRAILRARSIGPKMLAWIEAAGYGHLADFTRETPENIAFRIEACTGVRLDANGLTALRNLIEWSREAGS